MAEWGKGDPRWIVEDRPDGKKKIRILSSAYHIISSNQSK